MSDKKRLAPHPAKPKANPQFPYSRCSIGALARLLNAACGASAIHRGIREEIGRRALVAKIVDGPTKFASPAHVFSTEALDHSGSSFVHGGVLVDEGIHVVQTRVTTEKMIVSTRSHSLFGLSCVL
jgi:hypothetical protein